MDQQNNSLGAQPAANGALQKAQVEQMKAQQEEEMRSSMIAQLVLPDARERLSRIAIVKPEKAKAIEKMIIEMAQRGQLNAKIGETQLIDLLNKIGENEKKSSVKVTMRRKKYFSDEEDDDDDFK